MAIYEYQSVSVTLPSYGMPLPREPGMSPEELSARYPEDKPLSLDEFQAVLALIQPMRSPFPMFRFQARLRNAYQSTGDVNPYETIEMTCVCTVFDRETPIEPLTITFSEIAKIHSPTRRWLQATVRDFLVKCFTHELDEALLVGGVRVFDPHRQISGTVTF